MSSDVAISVEDLGKSYTIRHQHNDHVTLAQVALERVKHPLRRNEVAPRTAAEEEMVSVE